MRNSGICHEGWLFFGLTLITLIGYIFTECPEKPGIRLFGSHCHLKCHCKDNAKCDFNTGACATGCAPGWIGTGCQYANLAFNNSSIQRSLSGNNIAIEKTDLTVDEDIGTCSSPFVSGNNMWRIDFGDKHTVVGLNIYLKNESPATNGRTRLAVYVTNTTEDAGDHPICYHVSGRKLTRDVMIEITCYRPLIGQLLEIHVSEMSDLQLCEVQVYGGRELAFMKPTNHSSLFLPTHVSSVAVDGVMAENETYICFQTRRSRDPWWSVDLKQEFVIQSLVIYNRLETVLIDGFNLEINSTPRFGSSNLYVYNHTESTRRRAIRIDLAHPVLGQYIRITLPGSNRILTFCEVEVFGDCPEGSCGYDCQFTCLCNTTITGRRKINNTCPYGCLGRANGVGDRCNFGCSDFEWGAQCSETCGACTNQQPCDVINGTCLAGCQTGFKQTPRCQDGCVTGLYGKNCEHRCGFCADTGPCTGMFGTCQDQCEPGYKFPQCKTVCNPFTWGINCNMTCGKCRNGESCDHVTGECPVGCGFRIQETPRCDKGCEPMFYGPYCKRCGKCTKRCDPDTGSCTQCQSGYQLPLCQKECMPGQYGVNCVYTCGHCEDGVACNHMTGECPKGCMKQWKGDLCNIGTRARSLFGPPGQDHGTTAVVGLVLGGVGTFVCMSVMLVGLFIYCLRRKKKRREENLKYQSYMTRNQLGIDNQPDESNYGQTAF